MDALATVIRAFELPLQHADKEVWPLIREAWSQGSMLANWCARYLLSHDIVRLPAMQTIKDFPRMPPLPKGGLYAVAGQAFRIMQSGSWWAGATGSFAAITKSVTDYWMRHRTAVLWYAKEQPPRWNYPYPFPIRGQEWKSLGWENCRPYIDVNLPSGMPRKPLLARLTLRAGPEFGRQLDLFRQVEHGSLPRVELVIRQQGCSLGCHRPTIPGREPARVMVKMVAKLSPPRKLSDRVMTLCVMPGTIWVAELDGRPAWVANHEHVRRAIDWLSAHYDRLQRISQDAKAEVRSTGQRMASWRRSANRCRDKHARRMQSWLHEMASHAAGFAARNRVSELCYDDSQKSLIPLLPWYRLKKLLSDKCAAAGIVFRDMAHQEEGEDEYDSALATIGG